MNRGRVIPCLLLQNGGLVKTRRFANPQYIGDPINAIRIFNEKEVDELIVIDIDASKKGAEPDYELISQFASECFMPLTYGGGVNNVDQAGRLFALGVEKICVQSAGLEDTDLFRKLADRFGSQSIVVSVDVKRRLFGGAELRRGQQVSRSARTGWIDFMREAVGSGAGEVLLTAVDREGTLTGLDLRLIEEACQIMRVPIVATGGAGSLDDIAAGFAAGASAVAAGALFVLHGKHRAVLITYPSPAELDHSFVSLRR